MFKNIGLCYNTFIVRMNRLNTKRQGVFHYRMFKWNSVFYGICLEAGFVEEANTLEEVRKKLINGTEVLLMAVSKSKENLEPSLNTRPPFPYIIYYHVAPLIRLLEFLCGSVAY